MTTNDTEPLMAEWPENVEDPTEARETAEDLRRCINELVQHHTAASGEEMGHVLARLYTEWALEHVEELDREEHPYADQAASDLKQIVFFLD